MSASRNIDTRQKLWTFLDSLYKLNNTSYQAESSLLRGMTLENGIMFIRSMLGGIQGMNLTAEDLCQQFVKRYSIVLHTEEEERLLKWFRYLVRKST